MVKVREAWHPAVHGLEKSRTRLSNNKGEPAAPHLGPGETETSLIQSLTSQGEGWRGDDWAARPHRAERQKCPGHLSEEGQGGEGLGV